MTEGITVPDYIWFYFPLLFWGFALFMHYFYGVRRAEQTIEGRQSRIERRARQVARAA